MNPKKSAANAEHGDNHEPLLGLARLMKMAYANIDIAPLGIKMVERAMADPSDANALMDLSTIMHLDFAPDLAATLQEQALHQQRLYRLPSAAGGGRIRLLAIMAPGNLMANAPLEFLLEGSDIGLEMFYMSPDQPVPSSLPEHDVLFIAINERDEVLPLLERLNIMVKNWPRPVLNAPDRIALLARETASTLLASVPGVVMPVSARVDRRLLARVARGESAISALIAGGEFPVIIRPVDSHAGQGLVKSDDPSAITSYLQTRGEDEFYATRFVDYSGEDGMFRKYRVVLIGGRPYACHMAVSRHWMVHYLNAGMDRSAEKRAEEARFMANFDEDFASRHRDAFRAIGERIALDYMVIDCAETKDGALLVFEIDSGAVVHAMDPADIFPYKPPQMSKVFAAFRDLLVKAAEQGRAQK
jgi:glutathione synthase/RimK-type ligase-like ATP-grasp enzyme